MGCCLSNSCVLLYRTWALSKGLKQKVLIARALLHSPDVLFLDEPTSGLDPNAAAEIKKIIKDFKKSGKTVFLTTHNMATADSLCDTITIMKEGKILEYGNPHELKLKYSSKKIRIEKSTGIEEFSFEEFDKLNKINFLIYN